MAILVANCPRCGANKITLQLLADNFLEEHYGWKRFYETFCLCPNCHKTTVFVVATTDSSINDLLKEKGLADLGNGVTINNIAASQGFIALKD